MSVQEFLSKTFKLPVSSFENIQSLCNHSQKASPNSLFVALKGVQGDGHKHIQEAVTQGAQVLLVEETSQIPSDFQGVTLISQNTQRDFIKLLKEWYDYPSQKLFTIGVTGTNGKTTVSLMIEHIYNSCGWPTGVIGTIDQHLKDHKWPCTLTTPEPSELYKRLSDFVDGQAKACVMEVSSIGLDQNRVEGVDFDASVFTNLTWDHMDYHKNLENYFESKKKLFSLSRSKNFFSVINQDDSYGVKILKDLNSKAYTYGSTPSHFQFKIKFQNVSKTVFEIKTPFGVTDIELPLVGTYNVYNAVAALACGTVTGFKLQDCKQALETFPRVFGRMDPVTKEQDPFQVFVDYAHTPLALASVLKTLSPFKKDHNLIVVFGCGGDRDKEKRQPMVQEALKYGDKVFFTSDNPRFEDPLKIIEEGLSGLEDSQKSQVEVEVDREKAIEKALNFAQKGDIVLIAGKGHETYQILGDKKRPFNDIQVAQKFLKGLK